MYATITGHRYRPEGFRMPERDSGEGHTVSHEACAYVAAQVGYPLELIGYSFELIKACRTPGQYWTVHSWNAGNATCLSFPLLGAAAIIRREEIQTYAGGQTLSTLDDLALSFAVAHFTPKRDRDYHITCAAIGQSSIPDVTTRIDGPIIHLEQGLWKAVVFDRTAWIYYSHYPRTYSTTIQYDQLLRILKRYPSPLPRPRLMDPLDEWESSGAFALYGRNLPSVAEGRRIKCLWAARGNEQWVEKQLKDGSQLDQDEFALLGSFDHPAIMKPPTIINGVILEPYYPTLGEWADGQPLSILCTALAKLAEGVGHLHAQDCLHRDIKPGNILINEDHPLLTDFEFATWATDGPMVGKLLGSPLFMAPEILAQPSTYSPHSDIYALGVTCFQTLGLPYHLPQNTYTLMQKGGFHRFATTITAPTTTQDRVHNYVLAILCAPNPENRPSAGTAALHLRSFASQFTDETDKTIADQDWTIL